MTYAFVQDVPANEEIYGKIRAELGEVPPPGLIAHVVIRRPQGLRYVDVWERREDWERFRFDRVEPAVSKVLAGYGIPHDESLTSTEEVDVIHAWLGAA
jgi:hypothetical protein